MTTVQNVAKIFGIVFILIGVVGFFFSTSMETGLLLGMFPVNLLHNVVHLLFGLWGLAASKSFSGAKSYAQIAGILYIALAVLGFVSPDGFGLMEIGGNDVWLHALLGLALAYFGFTAKGDVVTASTV